VWFFVCVGVCGVVCVGVGLCLCVCVCACVWYVCVCMCLCLCVCMFGHMFLHSAKKSHVDFEHCCVLGACVRVCVCGVIYSRSEVCTTVFKRSLPCSVAQSELEMGRHWLRVHSYNHARTRFM